MSINKQLPCTDMQEAFLKHGFPLNMYLYKKNNKNSNNNITQGDKHSDTDDDYKAELHCVQSSQEVPVYKAIDVHGKERNIHRNSFSHAYYTVLKSDLTFRSLAEIHQFFWTAKKKKITEKCSRWVVCMRIEQSPDSGILLRRGQVFKLISYKDKRVTSRCNTNATNHRRRSKRAKIQFYGSQESFWIPHDLRGEFRLCETDPGVGKRDDMANIVQKYNFPILIRENENATSSHWCLLGVTTERFIISCTETRQIVVFPARNVLLRDVIQSLPLVSSLSQQELQSVETKVFSNKYFEEEEHYTGTFKDFGIFRKPELGLPNLPEKFLPSVPEPDYPESELVLPSVPVEKSLPPVPVEAYPDVRSVKPQSTPSPKPANQNPSIGSQAEGERRRTRVNTVRPPVPKRHPRYSLKLAAAVKAGGNCQQVQNNDDNDDVEKCLKKYLCTPILTDPDDTDPEENDDNSWDGDGGFDDEDDDDYDVTDYENQPRIVISEKTKMLYSSQRH